MNNKGVIYIMTNPSFPEYVKIGYTENIENRLKQLNQAETIPYAFRVYAVYETPNELSDKLLHNLIDALNPDLRSVDTFDDKKRVREFYALSKEDAFSLLKSIAKISGTENRLKRMKPEGHEIADEKSAKEISNNSRRGAFTFSECKIKVGSTIVFTKDKSITAIVVDDKHVKYKDETMSLSALGQKLLKCDYNVQGPLFFTYNGVVLDKLRNENNSK